MDGLEAQECGRRLPPALEDVRVAGPRVVAFAGKDATGRPVMSVCSRTSESGKAADVLARLGPGSVPKQSVPPQFVTAAPLPV